MLVKSCWVITECCFNDVPASETLACHKNNVLTIIVSADECKDCLAMGLAIIVPPNDLLHHLTTMGIFTEPLNC